MATTSNPIRSEFDADFYVFLQGLDASLNRPAPRPDPFSHVLLSGLFDNSREISAALAGRPEAAELLRNDRYRLFREWLHALTERKTELQRARLESHTVPFAEIVRFEASVRCNLAVLRLSGELHFRAMHRWEPVARAAAQRLALAFQNGAPAMA